MTGKAKNGKKNKPNLPDEKKQNYPVKHGLWVDFRKVQIDGRTRLGKWMKTLRAALTTDLGSDLSTMEEILLDRVISKVVRCHLYEVGIISGQDLGSRDFYLACCNSLRHDLVVLGLERRVKDLTGDLEGYLREKEQSSSQPSSSDPASGVGNEDEAPTLERPQHLAVGGEAPPLFPPGSGVLRQEI